MGHDEETNKLILTSSLLLCVALAIISFLKKVWWNPLRIQAAMRSQGIGGPSYRFIYGNSKEMAKMTKESMSRPMGLSHDLFPRLEPHMYKWVKAYGVNYLQFVGPDAQLVVTDLEFVKEIMINKDGGYPKKEANEFTKKIFGDGVAMCDGEKWTKLRRLANHAFHGESLKLMVPAMIERVDAMLERWKDHVGKEVEVFQEFKLVTSEVISKTAFGTSYLEGKHIFEMQSKIIEMNYGNPFKIRLPVLREFFKTADEKEADRMEKAIRSSIVGLVKKREEAMSKDVDKKAESSDFLGQLVKANHDPNENNRITIDELIDECITFYVAGQESISTTLSWTMLFLAVHTEWQQKAREEVFKVFGQQLPNSEGCGRLKTMSMILNETLRLYPPVAAILRRTGREVRLGNVIIPGNTNIIIPTLALHHDTRIWGDDALRFKPDRFVDGVAKATNNKPNAFIPFGMGPRICVGLNYANSEAKITLAMILQRYAFTLSPTYVHSPLELMAIQPEHGVQIILHTL